MQRATRQIQLVLQRGLARRAPLALVHRAAPRLLSSKPEAPPKGADEAPATAKKGASANTPANKAVYPDPEPETFLEWLFENPGKVVAALLGVLGCYLVYSWADGTQRDGAEEAEEDQRLVSGVEWRQLRSANRITVGEFRRLVSRCLELFPDGEVTPDDFLWVVNEHLRIERGPVREAVRLAAEERARVKCAADAEAVKAQREAMWEDRRRQLREREGRSTSSWLSWFTPSPTAAPTKQQIPQGFGADVYADDDDDDHDEISTLRPTAARDTEEALMSDEEFEARLPMAPDPEKTIPLAGEMALRNLPPASLQYEHMLLRLLESYAQLVMRGDGGLSPEVGEGWRQGPGSGVMGTLLNLARKLDPSERHPDAETVSPPTKPTLPLIVALTTLLPLVNVKIDARMDLLLALFTDPHPLLGGPAADVGLPEGYAAAQVDFRKRARSLGLAGRVRSSESEDYRALAPAERAHADGDDAEAAVNSSRFVVDLERPKVADAWLANDSVVGVSLEQDSAAADEAAQFGEAAGADDSHEPVHLPLSPLAIRETDVVRMVSALQATWQLATVSTLERERSWPFPRWKRRSAAQCVASAEDTTHVRPMPCPGQEGEHRVLSRADAMRLVWSNDVCVWGECPALRPPVPVHTD
jgi:hypothetical protein